MEKTSLLLFNVISMLLLTSVFTSAGALPVSSMGSLTITMPSTPEASVSRPQVTITGMGKTLNKSVNWNTQWLATTLTPGAYTVTTSIVSNKTHTYMANPINTTVKANAITHIEPLYTLRPASWDKIKHVVTIIFENTSRSEAVKQPYFKSLMGQGAQLSQYYAISHPSQPNYFALAGGSAFGVSDNNNHNINAKHIGNLLEAKGYTWKSYAEAYPGNCYLGASKNTYYRKHEPFISFKNVNTNSAECLKILPGSQFFTDLASNKLPTYSFYVPDINNDGHNKGVAFAAQWLSNTFGAVFSNPSIMSNTLFILTFDEDDRKANNNVYMVFLGAAVEAGATSAVKYNHYSTLKTVEDIFELGTLGLNDRSAMSISGIWMP